MSGLTYDILEEIELEREAQDAQYGHVTSRYDLPGTNEDDVLTYYGTMDLEKLANLVENWGRESMKTQGTVAAILAEEVGEALQAAVAQDRESLRHELIQVAAVAVFWVELLDLGAATR